MNEPLFQVLLLALNALVALAGGGVLLYAKSIKSDFQDIRGTLKELGDTILSLERTMLTDFVRTGSHNELKARVYELSEMVHQNKLELGIMKQANGG